MYIKQIANTLRTFGECFLNTHEIECEHPDNSPRTPRNWLRTLRQFPTSTTKLVANTPPGVGADSSCPYPDITNCTYSHYQIRISTLSNTHIRPPFRVYFPIYGHDKSAPTAADGLPITCFHLTTHTSLHYHTNIFVFCYL